MARRVTPRPWLDARLGELHKSKIDLARALGVNNSRIHEMITGERRIKVDEIDPMARFLEWSRPQLMKMEAPGSDHEDVAGEFDLPDGRAQHIDDLPVYEATDLGTGHFTLSAKPVTMIDRLPSLRKNTAAYAVSVVTDVLAPAIERGHMLYVDPTIAPAPGDDAIFIHSSGKRCLRRLVEVIDGVWKVKTFNPPRTHALQASDWPRAHKITVIQKR
jgi:phage repressor protein C with HTH and peptisase S24 domain